MPGAGGVRLLVDAATLRRRAPRMHLAAAGLALRGHAVEWAGAEPPGTARGPAVHMGGWGPGLARLQADVVIGAGVGLARAALGGLLARAHALVVDLDPRLWRHGSPLNRWAWDALYAAALIDPAAADAARGGLPGPMLERVALWPDTGPPEVPDPAHPDVEVLERACERALARHRGRVPRAAAFLDRDGTLVVEREYLDDPLDLELLPGVAGALQSLRAAGYALIVVSNQSGAGRGLFPLSRVHEVMARLRVALRERGVELDAIYFCPHRPDEGCACRKPGTALLERAAEDHQISLTASVMIGDKRIDAAAGQRAGGLGVLVRTGYGREEALAAGEDAVQRPPDYVGADLADAARWIIARHESLPSWT
jgi:histidinol-phosphate phosphatase family protein